jgi:hypothetical protein
MRRGEKEIFADTGAKQNFGVLCGFGEPCEKLLSLAEFAKNTKQTKRAFTCTCHNIIRQDSKHHLAQRHNLARQRPGQTHLFSGSRVEPQPAKGRTFAFYSPVELTAACGSIAIARCCDTIRQSAANPLQSRPLPDNRNLVARLRWKLANRARRLRAPVHV